MYWPEREEGRRWKREAGGLRRKKKRNEEKEKKRKGGFSFAQKFKKA